MDGGRTISIPHLSASDSQLSRSSLSINLSPFSFAFDFFYNNNSIYFSNKLWALQAEYQHRLSNRFAIALTLGYNEYYDLNGNNNYSIPISLSSVFLFPLDAMGDLTSSIYCGGGLMFSNFINKFEYNFLIRIGLGISYRVSEHFAIKSDFLLFSTVPVKYLDETKENILLTANSFIGISYIF